MKPRLPHYFALILALMIFLASVFAYIFIYHNVSVQTVKTAEAVDNVHAQELTSANEQKLNNILATTVNQRQLLGKYMLSSDATVQFIEKVEAIGAQSGSTLSLVSISANTDALSAHVEAHGSWSNVMRAIHIVESLPYSIQVNNMRVSFQGNGQWTGGFDIRVTLAPSAQTSGQ